jgi:type II restriction enzyme
VLGVTAEEGNQIDLYQNKGRFLYKYAGTFLENAAKMCLKERYPEAGSVRVPNTFSSQPKTFEIDCLVYTEAYELKWRDATTDGDHIIKEHSRLKVIAAANYTPIRLMFYYPNRKQASRIQAVLADLYKAVGGAYFHGPAAWEHLRVKTGIDLLQILENIAHERENQ